MKARGEDPPLQEYRSDVAYVGDYKPPGYEHAKDVSEMPLAQLNHAMAGKPGDKYRIRFHVRGKYKRISWTKDADAVVKADDEKYVHSYHIIGDHNYWTFEQMQRGKNEQDVHTATLRLLKKKTNFQIFRNEDWDQGFYPQSIEGDMYADISGPDEFGYLKRWTIHGEVGDVFRIEFRRTIVGAEDQKAIRWELERNEPVDFEELAKSHKYFLAGSWTDFKKTIEMKKDKNGNFFSEIIMGSAGTETFQILMNNNWLAAVHPSFNDATMFDDGHFLEGPDDGGAGMYWTMGMHPRDIVGVRDHAIIHLDIKDGVPHRVWWEKYDSPDIHHEYLAWGCQRIFERHCRLMGFTPYEYTAKAKLNNKPDFYE